MLYFLFNFWKIYHKYRNLQLLKNIFEYYYYDLETLRQDVADYIDFFNNMRPHQKLGMLTPTEAEEKFAEEK